MRGEGGGVGGVGGIRVLVMWPSKVKLSHVLIVITKAVSSKYALRL